MTLHCPSSPCSKWMPALLAFFVAACSDATLTGAPADGGTMDGSSMDGGGPDANVLPDGGTTDASGHDAAVEFDSGPRPDSCASGPNTYYFASTGDDSSADARSMSTPWRTLAKATAVAASLPPGACLLFKRGDTFAGTLDISSSGSLASPIVIGAYGSGAPPTFTGFTNVDAWSAAGANLWESTSTVSEGDDVNLVLVAGTNTPMGRWPDSGYYTMESASASSLSDTLHLNASSTDFTGAEAVIRQVRWVIDRYRVTGASGSSLAFDAMGSYTPRADWGYFVQDHRSTLSSQGEWFYDRATRHLVMYSAAMPVDVRAASVSVGVNVSGGGFITIDGVRFEGYTTAGVHTHSQSVDGNSGAYVTVQACEFTNLGRDGVYGYPNSSHLNVVESLFSEINSSAILAGSSDDAVIRGNVLRNIGNIVGAGASGDGGYEGIVSNGDRGEITFNNIRNVGYVGIKWDGNGTRVANNVVDTTNYIKDDGGGIYCYPSQGPVAHSTRRVVRDNIVLNSVGAGAGTNSPTTREADGIYNDGTSSDVDYIHNTVVGAELGIFLNGAHETLVEDNVVMDCRFALYFQKYNDVQIENVSVQSNVFVAGTTEQYAASYRPMAPSMPASFAADNNVYARPVDSSVLDSTAIWHVLADSDTRDTLSSWQAFSGQDAHSSGSPLYGVASDSIRVEYNPTNADISIPLVGSYRSMDGAVHSGTVSLSPFDSIVLIREP